MKKARFAGLIAALVLIGTAIGVRAIYPDAELEAGVLRIISGGATLWKVGVNSSGQFFVQENNNLGADALNIDDNTGDLGIRTRTSTQLLTDVPSASNRLIINSTTGNLCISTGTGGGAYVYVTTSAVVAGRIACSK